MATIQATHRVSSPPRRWAGLRFVNVAAWLAMYAIAIGFAGKYAVRYYVHYNQAFFSTVGAPNYWPHRGWLIAHISGGMCALLTGPWQFWTGFRRKYASGHRWMGRLFLLGVVVGSIGAFHMAYTTVFGWTWGFALFAMALAWITTSAMAYYAVLQRQVQIHKEWMVRAYVVTFAFVNFRLLNDYGLSSRLQPQQDRALTYLWLSWAVPLLVAEVCLQLRQLRRSARAK